MHSHNGPLRKQSHLSLKNSKLQNCEENNYIWDFCPDDGPAQIGCQISFQDHSSQYELNKLARKKVMLVVSKATMQKPLSLLVVETEIRNLLLNLLSSWRRARWKQMHSLYIIHDAVLYARYIEMGREEVWGHTCRILVIVLSPPDHIYGDSYKPLIGNKLPPVLAPKQTWRWLFAWAFCGYI